MQVFLRSIYFSELVLVFKILGILKLHQKSSMGAGFRLKCLNFRVQSSIAGFHHIWRRFSLLATSGMEVEPTHWPEGQSSCWI